MPRSAQDQMITGQLGKPPPPLPPEMSETDLRGHERPDTPDSEPCDQQPSDGEDRDRSAEPYGTQGSLSQCNRPDTPTEQNQLNQSYPSFPVGPQHLLSTQQLASAVAGVVPGHPPCLNQPVLLPFNMAGQLGGQQGLVLTMPSASLANIQGLMAAAAAGGIMTLPLQNLQATSSLNSHLQHIQKLQQLQNQQQQHHQRQRLQYQQHLQQQKHQQQHQHQRQQHQHHLQHQNQHQHQEQQQQHHLQQKHQEQQHQHHLQHQCQQQHQEQQQQHHLQQKDPGQQHQPHLPQQQRQQAPPHQSLNQHSIQLQLSPPDQQQSPSSSSSLSSSQELRKPSPSLPVSTTPPHRQSYSPSCSLSSPRTPPSPLQLNSVSSQSAAAAAISSMGGTQPFGSTMPGLQSVGGQLVTNAQGQIIGTIPLMPNSTGPPNQAGGGASGLPVQPITPQLLTNAQGQIIATVIGNQILPVINTQGITLSPVKPGQQVQQGQVGLHHRPHGPASVSQGPIHQASSTSNSTSSTALSVGQLVNNPLGGAGEAEGVNLEEIREFAKAFKIRRLSLGLTQNQVGQALSAAEGPAYSQSAICRHTILRGHFLLPQEAQESSIASALTAKLNPGLLYPARFEKLDITPKSAQKIKPVLERWMAEAEARHRSGIHNLSEFIGNEPSKKRKRRTSFTPQALEILNTHFERNTHPSGQEMTEIAEKLNYDREVVRVWFCNKRQALKNTIKRLKPAEIDSTVPMESLTDALLEPLDKHP